MKTEKEKEKTNCCYRIDCLDCGKIFLSRNLKDLKEEFEEHKRQHIRDRGGLRKSK